MPRWPVDESNVHKTSQRRRPSHLLSRPDHEIRAAQLFMANAAVAAESTPDLRPNWREEDLRDALRALGIYRKVTGDPVKSAPPERKPPIVHEHIRSRW